jgi:hypothetical protein
VRVRVCGVLTSFNPIFWFKWKCNFRTFWNLGRLIWTYLLT